VDPDRAGEKGPLREEQERFENEKEMRTADIDTATEEAKTLSTSKTEDALGSLLQSGAQFLMDLSKALSQPEQEARKPVDSFISRDEQTGKSFLKIPLPRPEVLEGLFSTFGELLSKFQKGD
jgi:hypothetical protein